MIAAVVADLHLTEAKGDSYATLEEQVEICDWIGRDATEHDAEILLVAGDTFHSKSTVAERNAAIEVYQSWAERFPIIAVKGNNTHDAPGDIAFLGKLRSRNPILVFEEPGQYITNSGDVIACLPYPEKALLASRLEPGQDVGQMAAQAMRAILLGLSVDFGRHRGARILLGHLEVGSSVTDCGQPLIGKAAVEISEGDLLDSGADVVCLGHIHKFQTMADSRIFYAGGIRQTTFGEDPIKGYCLVDVARGRAPVITHRQGPGRVLVTIEAAWPIEPSPAGHVDKLVSEDGAPIEEASVQSGTAIRLVYEVSEDHRQQAAEQADTARQRWLDAGAHSVKLDARTITTHRVRSEEIRAAKTTAEKLEALWASRGQRPEHADRLLAKLATLEGEVVHV